MQITDTMLPDPAANTRLIREIGDVVVELLNGRPLTMSKFQEMCANQLIQGMLEHGPDWMHLSDCLLLDPLERFHEAMILLAQNPLPPIAVFLPTKPLLLVTEFLSTNPLLPVTEFLSANPLPPIAEFLPTNPPHPIAEFLPANQATISAVCTLVLFLLAGKQLTWKIYRALHHIPAIEKLLRDAPVQMKLNDCLMEGGFRDDMTKRLFNLLNNPLTCPKGS